MSAPKEFNIMD